MITRKIMELSQLVPDDTSALIIACCLFEDFDLAAASTANFRRGFGVHSFLLRDKHGSEVAAVSRANAPRWCGWVVDEYVPSDVAGHQRGGFIEIVRGHGLGRNAFPRCGFVKADRHLHATSAVPAMAGFHQDPNPEPPWIRPEHPE